MSMHKPLKRREANKDYLIKPRRLNKASKDAVIGTPNDHNLV